MCLNLTELLRLKTIWHFAKWDGLNILFLIQYIRCFNHFWGSANVLLQIPLKMGKNQENFESNIFFEAQKYYFAFELRLIFFLNGHICNVVLTLPNVMKIYVENDNVVWTLSNIVQFNVEKHIVASTIFNVVNFNVDVHNAGSTLIWRCPTSRRYINLKPTLNRHWNICWAYSSFVRKCVSYSRNMQYAYNFYGTELFVIYVNVCGGEPSGTSMTEFLCKNQKKALL